MAEIKSFRGILYNRERVSIEKNVTPPYDVISPSMQGRFYGRDAHNIIRIILGKEGKKDTARNNRYTRARALLNQWLKQKIFIKDRNPSIYIYTQRYLHKGKKRTRIGFISLMKIEDPKESGILPHEYTLDKPKKDRLNLIKKTKANLSPIFSLFRDKDNEINKTLKGFIKSRPPIFAVDTDGVTHKLWKVSDKSVINKIKRNMRDKKIFIADGHHRYEVALSYRNMMHGSKAFNENMDYVMMYFTNLSEKGRVTVLSTHRVIKSIAEFKESKIRLKLEKYFHVKNMRSLERVMENIEKTPRKKHVIGMYAGQKKFYLLTLKKVCFPKKLDVTILHDLVINKILSVKNPKNNIKYIRDVKAAARLIDKGGYELAFFLRPTTVSDMRVVAEKGEMMPQKSTYFYPKLLSGLVINKF